MQQLQWGAYRAPGPGLPLFKSHVLYFFVSLPGFNIQPSITHLSPTQIKTPPGLLSPTDFTTLYNHPSNSSKVCISILARNLNQITYKASGSNLLLIFLSFCLCFHVQTNSSNFLNSLHNGYQHTIQESQRPNHSGFQDFGRSCSASN